MTGSYALGIDVSTTEVRVTVIDTADGTLACEAALPLPAPVTDGDRREQEADFGRLALAAVDKALAYPLDGVVGGVSITATSGTVVAVDALGRQTGPAVLYDDRRASRLETELARASHGRPTAMLARIAALLAERPDARVASVDQVVAAALAGRPVSGDTSHFLKAGIDPVSASWPDALLALAGVDRSRLPELVAPGGVLGRVTVGAATGATLIAGMSDGCTSQLATGAVADGESVGIIGTTFVLKVVSDLERLDASAGIYSHRSPDGRYWAGGASNVGGGSFALPAGASYDDLGRRARDLGPSRVVAYPLVRTGERFPLADASFAGFAVDLDGRPVALPEDPAARYRAVIEGVALVERLALESLGLDPAAEPRVVSGGATKSSLWNEVRAATLGASVRLPLRRDSGFGAAVLAAWGVGDDEFVVTVRRLTGTGELIDPDETLRASMASRYDVFRAALLQTSGR